MVRCVVRVKRDAPGQIGMVCPLKIADPRGITQQPAVAENVQGFFWQDSFCMLDDCEQTGSVERGLSTADSQLFGALINQVD
ncbi:hypothetical protein D3C76_1077890 [compost metagenome]